MASAEKAQIARDLGADEVILYNETDFEAETKRLTDGAGVDVVYDSVGLDHVREGAERPQAARHDGALRPVQRSRRAARPAGSQRERLALPDTPDPTHYIATREELLWRAQDVFGWIAAGELRVRIDKTFPLAEASAAHQYLEDRKTQGKVLLLPW